MHLKRYHSQSVREALSLARAENINRFIVDGDKAKVVMYFRGREIIRPDLGMKVFDKIIQSLTGKYQIETNPRLEGNHITMVVAPKS